MKYLKISILTAVIGTSAWFGYSSMGKVEKDELFLTNVEALTHGEDDEKTETDSRIVSSCDCWAGNSFRGISITKCEEYEWKAPMIKQNCSTSSCPSGASC